MVPRLPILVTLSLLGGCFRYAPVQPDAVRPRETIRARLTAEGSALHQAVLGFDETRLEGTVSGLTPGGLALLTGGLGTRSDASVDLRWTEIDGIERRELDRLRTILVAGAGIAAGVAILELAGGEAAAGPPGGGPEFARLPLLRWGWAP